jgi:YgiT-type zinc finger domain-containing protein
MARGFSVDAGAVKCVVCKHGETRPGTTTVPLTQDGTTLVVKGVPQIV